MKVFLDANILYSAARPQSLMARFVEKLLRHADGCTNLYAAEEAQRNLAAKQPDGLQELTRLLQRLALVAELVDVRDTGLKQKDLPILGGAVAAQCTHLVTSDKKDFGKFYGKSIHGVKVVSATMMAEELEQSGLLRSN